MHVSRKNLTELSSAETLLLRWASEGKSLFEVAAIEGINWAEVRYLFDEAASKLGAASISEAIEKALALNMI